MRGLVLLFSVVLAIGLLHSQAPQAVPEPMRGMIEQTETSIASLIGSNAANAAPIWPNALDPGVRRGPPGWMLLAAGLGLAAAGAAFWFFRLRGANEAQRGVAVPEWLIAARTLAAASSDGRERRQHCALIEKNLVPDLKHRGEAALARAHQLDIYARYVARNPGAAKSTERGADTARWRAAAQQALDAIAVAPTARNLTAFKTTQSSLWALDAGDARELRHYYERLGTLLEQHDKAWSRAKSAISKTTLRPAELGDAMEELRQINRTIAKESASLVGDIEISVRSVS